MYFFDAGLRIMEDWSYGGCAGRYELYKTYASANTGKSRTIVTTDGEVDDMDSFMRLMLYSNDIDIAGIILGSSSAGSSRT